MKKNTFLFSFIFLLSVTINAQEKDGNIKKLPISIYTYNSYSLLNKNLDLKKVNSAFTDAVTSETNQFSLNVKNIKKISSNFIYDDLRRYQDRKIIKEFILEHDPISWNLHYNQQQALAPKT